MSQFTSITMAESIQAAIATDADLLAWCQTTYGKSPTVYLGVDEDQPAAESEYPVIGIVNVRRSGSIASNAVVWEVDLGCAVINSNITASGIIKTYPGLLQANYLTERVEIALIQSRLFRSVDFNGESGAIVDYPAFVAYSTITLGLHASSRAPRFR